MSGVEAVYVRHSRPWSPGFVVGQSDLDLTIVLSETIADDPDWLENLYAWICAAERWHFYLNPRDVRFTTARALNERTALYSSPVEILYTPAHWQLIAGREVRDARALEPAPFPAADHSRHPEFNKWWRRQLPTRVFTIDTLGSCRGTFRGALKNQLHLMATDGEPVPMPGDHISDEIPYQAFRNGDAFPLRLAKLYDDYFRATDARALETQVLLDALREVAARCPVEEITATGTPPRRAPDPDERILADELAARIAADPVLDRTVVAVFAYADSLEVAGRYRIEWVLADDISDADFESFIHAFEASVGMEADIDGSMLLSSFHLERMAASPFLYDGESPPFLREHVERYAFVIRGEAPAWWSGAASHADRLERCRIAFPFYAFNFERSPARFRAPVYHLSLASLRLYLETGIVATERDELRSICRDVFDDPVHEEILECELEEDESRAAYEREAFAHVVRECARIEALLAKTRDADAPFDGEATSSPAASSLSG